MAMDVDPAEVPADSLRSLALVLGGRSYREAAAFQGLPPSTVARHLSDALKSLRRAEGP